MKCEIPEFAAITYNSGANVVITDESVQKNPLNRSETLINNQIDIL